MANTQICSLDDHYPIQLLDDLYHITVSLEKVVRLLPDQPDRFRRPCILYNNILLFNSRGGSNVPRGGEGPPSPPLNAALPLCCMQRFNPLCFRALVWCTIAHPALVSKHFYIHVTLELAAKFDIKVSTQWCKCNCVNPNKLITLNPIIITKRHSNISDLSLF